MLRLFTEKVDAMSTIMRYIGQKSEPLLILTATWSETQKILKHLAKGKQHFRILCLWSIPFFLLYLMYHVHTDSNITFYPNMAICAENACHVFRKVRYLL